MQAGVHRRLVAGLAGRGDVQGVVQELERAAGGLLAVALLEGVREFQQGIQPRRTGDDQVAEVRTQGGDEMQGVETLGKDLVEGGQRRGVTA